MKKINKKKLILIGYILFLGLCSVAEVYAKTSSEAHFCDYSGTRRTLKLVGEIINILKIVAPIILIIMSVIDCGKAVIASDPTEIKKSLPLMGKRLTAALIIFLVPALTVTIFDYFVDYNMEDKTNTMATCTACILRPKECTIPDKDPQIYVNE